MLKITKIQAQKRKGRYNIFINGEYEFAVSENILIQYHLYKDTELTEEEINLIKEKENVDKNYVKALNYISHQIRTKKEINDYLQKKEVDEETISEIIKKLETDKYLNDELYAQSFINTQLLGTDGPVVIKNKMIKKGIEKNLADESLLKIDYDNWIENATKAAMKIMKRSGRRSFKNTISKIKIGLMQKGYTTEMIEEVISKMDIEINTDLENENLMRELEKAKKHYLGKDNYKNKVYQSLMRKGFSSSDITKYLNE